MKAWGQQPGHDMKVLPHLEIPTELAETPRKKTTDERGRSHAHTTNRSTDVTRDPEPNLLIGGKSPGRMAIPIRTHVPGNLQERTRMLVKPSPDPRGERDLIRLPPKGSTKNNTTRL